MTRKPKISDVAVDTFVAKSKKKPHRRQRFLDAARRWEAVERLTEQLLVACMYHSQSGNTMKPEWVTGCRTIASNLIDERGMLLGASPYPTEDE